MSDTSRSIALNAAVLTGSEMVARVLSLVLIMVVSRRLGPAVMGIYAFGVTLIAILEIFTNFGLMPYVQREMGRRPERAVELFDQVFSLKLVIYLACLGAAVGLSFLLAEPGLKRQVIWILAGAMFFNTNMVGTNAFFRGLHRAHYEAAVRLGSRLFYTLTGMAAVLAGYGLLTLVGLEAIATVGACLAAWLLFALKVGRPFKRITLAGARRLFDVAKSFLALRLVQMIFNSIDLIFVSVMAGNAATGLYSVTIRLTEAFIFVPAALTGAFLPVLSRHRGSEPGQDDERFIPVFRPYFKQMVIAGAGLAGVMAGTAPRLIVFLFGPQFAAAGTTLILMTLALFLTFINWSLSSAIIALDLENRIVRLFAWSAGFNIVANLIAIPIWQHNGAAATTVLSQGLLLALQINCLGDLAGRAGLIGLTARPLAAGLGLAAGLWGLGGLQWPTPYYLALAALAYPGLLFLLRALTLREVIDLVRQLKTRGGTP